MKLTNDNNQEPFYRLATRYLSGESSSQERQRLVELLTDPRWNALFEDIRCGWDSAAGKPAAGGWDAEAASRKLTALIANSNTQNSARAAHPFAPRPVLSWARIRSHTMAIAASFAVLAAATALFVHRSPQQPLLRTAGVHATAPWIERPNGPGERSTVTLRDGTHVTLNAGSTLSYPETFDRYTRVVRLNGEAFFDVAHDAARPFTVETETLHITVLGTQFNVTAFADGTPPQVALVTGRVQITGISPQGETVPVVLAPGEKYSFSPATGESQVQSVAAEVATGWMHDVLIWDREPVAAAMRTLERRFGVTIGIDDPHLAAETLTGRFKSESLEEIFSLLQLTGIIDYRIVRNNGQIVRVVLTPGLPTALP